MRQALPEISIIRIVQLVVRYQDERNGPVRLAMGVGLCNIVYVQQPEMQKIRIEYVGRCIHNLRRQVAGLDL